MVGLFLLVSCQNPTKLVDYKSLTDYSPRFDAMKTHKTWLDQRQIPVYICIVNKYSDCFRPN